MILKNKKNVETNRYELEISIPADEFEAAVAKVFNRESKKISVPGFRKGKAPRRIVERIYGENVFYEDALNDLYPGSVNAALEEAGLEPAGGKIDFDLVSIGKEGAEFKVTLTVKPEVEIGEYKGLKAERGSTEVSDEEINEELNKMAERNARLVEVSGRKSKKGDTVIFDFEGFIDDKPFEGGKAENYTLELGTGAFIPGFEEQMEGRDAGEEFDVNVTFPEDYHAEEIKGKPAVFKIKLHEIKEKELPAIDDDFCKDVSEFDTLDELKADIKHKAEHRKEHESEDKVELQLVDQLIDSLKADIPDVMFETRIDENVRDFDYRLQMQGMNLKDYLKYTGAEEKDFRESFRAQAERQVKLRLALEKIAKLENLYPSDEETDAEYKRLAGVYNVSEAKVKSVIPAYEVKGDLAVGKAMELVKTSAELVDAVESDAKTEKSTAKKSTKAASDVKSSAKSADKPSVKKTSAKSTKASEKDDKPAAKSSTKKSPVKKADNSDK